MPPRSPLDLALGNHPLWLFQPLWLAVRCGCGRSVGIPGQKLPYGLADVSVALWLGRLRCRTCGSAPADVTITDRVDGLGVGGPPARIVVVKR